MSHFPPPGRSSGSPTLSAVMAGLMMFVPLPGIRGALCAMFPMIAQRTWWVFFKSAVIGLTIDLAICVSIAFVYPFSSLSRRTSTNLVLETMQPLSWEYAVNGSAMPLSRSEFFVIMSLWTLGLFVYWNGSWLRPRGATTGWVSWSAVVACAVSVSLLLLAVDVVDEYVYRRWYRPFPIKTPAAILLALGYQAAVAVPCAVLGHIIARRPATDAED